jgi:hypothetical protein
VEHSFFYKGVIEASGVMAALEMRKLLISLFPGGI